ncbi:hypothetical protein SLS64_002448 [Diaporthe eres]
MPIDVERSSRRLLKFSCFWVQDLPQIVGSIAWDSGRGENVIDFVVLGDGSVEERSERAPIADISGYVRQAWSMLGEQGFRERILITNDH